MLVLGEEILPIQSILFALWKKLPMGLSAHLIILISLAMSSCGTLVVRSSPPEADVSIMMPGKEIAQPLGKTPYEEDIDKLEDMVNEGTVVIIVEKRGYTPQPFIVPNLGHGRLEIEANLLPNLPSNYKEVNTIISHTLEAERFLIEKRTAEALKVAEKIKELNRNIVAAYEIEATAHFLDNKFKESRFAWIRALELEPNNPEGQTMLALIEQKMGIKPSLPQSNPEPKR